MASAPTPLSINYQIQSRASGADFAERAQGDWTPVGLLMANAEALDTVLTVSTTFLPSVGDGAIIGDEIVRIDQVDAITGKLTVGRGCADTLPVAHVAGTHVWFYRDALESDGVEYIGGETSDVRLLTRTSSETLQAEQATIESTTLQQRQARPYLPGNIRINGKLYPSNVTKSSSYTLSFSHRDRVLQSDRLVDCTEESIGPEPGVSYRLTLTNQDTEEVVWTQETTSDEMELPYVNGGIIIRGAVHILTLSSTRGGIESLYRYQAILPRGYYLPPIIEPEPVILNEGKTSQEPGDRSTA